MALFHDAQRARRNRRIAEAVAAGWIVVRRLNKNGTFSAMLDATTRHPDPVAAMAHVQRVRALNPGKILRFAIDGKEV